MKYRPFLAPSALLLALLAPLASGCSGEDKGPLPIYLPNRTADDRTPLTAPCDDNDVYACLLPWPSSTFLKADPNSPTKLRLAVEASSLFVDDDPTSINRADGFSRVTPLVTAFPFRLDPITAPPGPDGPVRLILAEPSHPDYGKSVPLRLEVLEDNTDETKPVSMLFAYPLQALEPNAAYVAVVLYDLTRDGGERLLRSRPTKLAIGIGEPFTQEEAEFTAYHGPTRDTLQKADIHPGTIVRAWDFYTRSADDATRRLAAMRDAATQAATSSAVSVVIDSVNTQAGGDIAAIVEGKLAGLPSFVGAEGGLTLDDAGLPIPTGKHEAPFRVVLPVGSGDYRFVMYGHGTGGSYHDSAFDAEVASLGAAKVGIEFYGWTETEVLDTFVSLKSMLKGTEHSSARLMQAVADGIAIEQALSGVLGDALSAPMLDNAPNPMAGRRPDTSNPIWAGGSLGGTMGLVYSRVSPTIGSAVLNVPGAAWTHFIPGSNLYATIQALFRGSYGSDLYTNLTLAISQSNWDDIDGAVWKEARAGDPLIALIQESLGDPVLPNPGTEMVAVSTNAHLVGKMLDPIYGIGSTLDPESKSGITQYRVPDTDALDIHGFAARNTAAGVAAREQIQAFLQSVWAGKPTITVPSGCPNGVCYFTNP